MEDVHISAQSLIQGGQSDGERVDALPAPEAQQRVTGEASAMHEAHQDVLPASEAQQRVMGEASAMHEVHQDISVAWNES